MEFHCHDAAVNRITATTRSFPDHRICSTTRRFHCSVPRQCGSQVHYHDGAVPLFTATTRLFPGSLPLRGCSPFTAKTRRFSVHCNDATGPRITATTWRFRVPLPRRGCSLFTYLTGLFHGLLPRRGCSSDQGYDAPFPLVHSQDVAVPRFTPTTRLFPG